jgi:hypothetical protein
MVADRDRQTDGGYITLNDMIECKRIITWKFFRRKW